MESSRIASSENISIQFTLKVFIRILLAVADLLFFRR